MMSKITRKIGWPIFIVLAIVPAAFWIMIEPLGGRFFDWQLAFTSIGQLLGLIGMALFSLNLILAARLKWLEPFFFGLNRVYIKHHLVGALALILLLFHPLFLAVRMIPFSLREAALFFVPFNDSAVTYGIFALLLLIALLAVTFYAKWPYERWKASHKFLGLAFFLASLHMFFIPSDVSRSASLRAYMFFLVMAGLAAVIYRSIFSAILVRKYKYTVAAVREVNPAVIEIELAGGEKNLRHEPGQFLFISFRQPGIGAEYHPFTIASGSGSSNLKLTIKNLGDFTAELKKLKAGASAKIEGPFGKFSYLEAPGREQIWLAGGIGITPFLSMARSLKPAGGYRIDLFYCVRTMEEAVFIDELNEIARRDPQLRVIPFCTDIEGYLSAETVAKHCALAGKEIFVCGPPAMMKGLKDQFRKLNIPADRIHSEEFALL